MKKLVAVVLMGFFFCFCFYSSEPLTIQQRIDAQISIDKTLYENRIWPESNIAQKPSFESFYTREDAKRKVENYLKESNALEKLFNFKTTHIDIQNELNRIVANSKDKVLLKKIFDSLNNDPRLIAECLVRPLVVDKKIRSLFSSNQSFQKESRKSALAIFEQISNGKQINSENCIEETVKYVREGFAFEEEIGSSKIENSLPNDQFDYYKSQLTSSRKPFMNETSEGYEIIVPVSVSENELVVKKLFVQKINFDSWWNTNSKQFSYLEPFDSEYSDYKIQESSPNLLSVCDDKWIDNSLNDIPDPRYAHNAVWTGSEMIIWGGGYNSGAKYNPATDTWTPITRQGAVPSPRTLNTAVWSGTEMIIWGGWDGSASLNSGSRYNPTTDTWTLMTINSPCPSARKNHSASWCGSYGMVVWGGEATDGTLLNDGARYLPATDEWVALNALNTPEVRRYAKSVFISPNIFIVWGGSAAGDVPLNSGGVYDLSSDTWSATSTSGNCPVARKYHTAISANSQMMVWGGEGAGGTVLNSGAKYDYTTDTWTTITLTGAPSARRNHTAVWTDSEMIVWGGENGSTSFQNGAKYDPSSDLWTTISTVNAPTARYSHTAIWSGTEMIVWGGYWPTNSGGRYNPVSNSWTPTSLGTNVPAGRQYHTAIWTGTEMIVWGGESLGPTVQLNTGGKYVPATDSWSATSTLSPCPVGRRFHTAIWTGTDMIIWGGYYYDGTDHYLDSGSLYNPTTDTWSSTSSTSAPTARSNHTAVWTGTEMIIWGGYDGNIYLNTGARYNPTETTWTATTTTGAASQRRDHTAIWSGTYMIVWGGFNGSAALNTGAMYNPTTNSWTSVSTSSAPAARYYHTAVWAEQVKAMVVWGGTSTNPFNSGGIYYPATNKWVSTSTASPCPAARRLHSAVWTGEEMIVWGGMDINGKNRDDGGRFNPYTNAWSSVSTGPNYATPRSLHTAIWTGQYMFVWGGSGAFSSGGTYEPPPQIVGYYEACGSGPVLLTATGIYLAYQWTKDGVDILDATESSYLATETGDYNVKVTLTDMSVCEGVLHHVDCWGYPTPAVTGSNSGCVNPGVVLSTSSYSAYQWIKDGTDISGATQQTYTAKSSGVYQVRVTDIHGCQGVSSGFTLTVYDNPVPVVQGVSQGCPTLLSTTEEFVTYQWKLGSNNIPGATSREYLATANGTYTVVVTDVNGCSGTSANYTISNYPVPTITGNSKGCEGSYVTLTTGSFASYQWYKDGQIIGGATGPSYDATSTGSYTVEVTDANGCIGISAAKVVTFYPPPVPTVTGDHGPACYSNLSTSTTYSAYQWIKDDVDIPNATSRNYTATLSGTYKVRVTDSNGCVGTSDGFVVTLYDPPTPPTILGPSSGCSENGVTLSTQSYSTYQWYVNGTSIPGATYQSYLTTQSGFNNYTVSVTDQNGCLASSSVGLWVNLDPPRPGIYQNEDFRWITNGKVYALKKYNNTMFVGGEFTYIGPYTGNCAFLNPTTSVRDADFPTVEGSVTAIVSDGSGGFYIGGSFTRVGGYTRSNLAHIKADKSVDQDFAPGVNGNVYAMLLSGTDLYIGGDFSSVNSQTRNRIARINTTTGQVSGWAPNINNNIVYAIAEYQNQIIIGGTFTQINSQTYNRLAAIDKTTALATLWNPNVASTVRGLAISGSTLVVVGEFTTASGVTRNRVCSYDMTSGNLTNWNPNANNNVYSVAIYGNIAYIGGTFTQVSSQTRNRIAALDLTATSTPFTTSWNPNISAPTGVTPSVNSIAVSSDGLSIYAGGLFTTVGSATRSNLARINSSDALVDAFDPVVSSTVKSLAVDSNYAAVGGDFTSLNGYLRNRLAQIDLSTGEATDFNPNITISSGTAGVYALEIYGGTLYFGGSFTSVGATARNRIAAIDIASQTLTTWNPNSGGIVRTLLLSGDTLFVGGEFTSIGGQTRNRLASFDLTTGSVTSFNPNMSGTVYTLAIDGSTLYAGGAFTQVNGSTARNRLAALDIASGTATSFNPNMSSNVRCLIVTPTLVYAGGDFTTVAGGSTTRNRLASFDKTTSEATSFNPNINSSVYSIYLDEAANLIYAGGTFTTVNSSVTRSRLAAFDISTGNVNTNWNPNADSDVYFFLKDENGLSIGGNFTAIKGIKRNCLAFVPVLGNQCSTNGTLLSTEKFSTYQWYKDGNAISGAINPTYMATSPGVYKVSVTRTGGCIGESSEFTVYSSSPQPEISGPSTGCTNPGVVLSTIQSYSSYQWYLDGNIISGATSQNYTATTSGSYTVSVTDTYGCSALSPAHLVTLENCGGGGEVSSKTSLYPLRIVKDANSSTGFYIYFEKVSGSQGYNIYEGNVGTYYSHGNASGNICSASVQDMGNGEMRMEFPVSTGNHYYLVTQFTSGVEGPSGYNSNDVEIDPAQSTCVP